MKPREFSLLLVILGLVILLFIVPISVKNDIRCREKGFPAGVITLSGKKYCIAEVSD